MTSWANGIIGQFRSQRDLKSANIKYLFEATQEMFAWKLIIVACF